MSVNQAIVRWRKAIAKITLVGSQNRLEAMLESLRCENLTETKTLGFVNAHAMNMIVGDSEFYESLLSCDYLLRDGSGMSFLYKNLGCDPGLNMNGTDFIPKLLETNRGSKVAIWGSTEPWLERSRIFCQEHFDIELVSILDGFQDIETYAELSRKIDVDMILLGMGMPKQEIVATRLKKELTDPSLIICGGAIIDFMGGKFSRAPNWLRRIDMEWLYRLFLEPRRMFKRYIIGNPLFVSRTLRFRVQK